MKGLEGNKWYSGVALTLIDSLSTLAVIGDAVNFEKSVLWLSENVRPIQVHTPLAQLQSHTGQKVLSCLPTLGRRKLQRYDLRTCQKLSRQCGMLAVVI